MINENTAELVQNAASGDPQAFGILVTRYASIVTGVAYSVCGDFSRSEDLGQEAFIEAWKNLATLRDSEKFVPWICTIVRRRAVDALRAAKMSPPSRSLENMSAEFIDAQQPSPEASMSQEQERQLVWSMLESLPETYREPMILFYRCEQSTRDVANALGENEATIRQRLKRGREMIRSEVSETLRKTLWETAPKAAFAGLVIASLPSASYAAGATVTTAVATGKSSFMGSVVAASAMSGAALGSLIGLLGGAFGTWMGWKYSEYESQQKFIVRHTLLFVAGFVIFGVLLASLIQARLHGFIDNDTIYGRLLVGLILGYQALNLVWIWHSIFGYQKLRDQSRASGEPMREPARQMINQLEQQTRVVRPDGSVGYDAFRWDVGAWLGSSLGSTAWMLTLAFMLFWHGSILAGAVVSFCFLIGVAFAFGLWQSRDLVSAYHALQLFVGLIFVLTIVALAAIQFLANEPTRLSTHWTPWAWFILLIYPIVSVHFHWVRSSFEQDMLKRHSPSPADNK